MLARVSKDAEYFLEPSAGRGDLADVIKGEKYDYHRRNVDCIEPSPDLAAILVSKDYPVVGHDFLDYPGVCYYDAIVMNPPFSNGDEHLLRAWDFLHDGEIVCLLNEETVLNPHTERRKRLAHIIAEHGAVEYLGECFSTAVRKTDVRVALVYLKKVAQDDAVDLWAKTSTEEKAPNDGVQDPQWLAIKDKLGNMQHYYDQAQENMFLAFQYLRRAAQFLGANDIYIGQDYDNLVQLGFKNLNSAKAEFTRKHRRDAWLKVFEKMEFRKWLDKKQTDEFIRDIERNGNIPFTADNIKGTLENVFVQRRKLFEMSVANVFDELTRYYKGNQFHNEGWKTNDSYKVNRRLVFPYGCQFDHKFCRSFNMRYNGSDIDIYNDLDRVLCVLDGQDFTQCRTIHHALDTRFRSLGHNVHSPFDNSTESQYFEIKFFMKGTVHLFFKDERLWQEFNITAAKGKAWLGERTQDDPEAEAPIASEADYFLEA
jgi:hypothetical protein